MRPRPEERQDFLAIFDKFRPAGDDDSSDAERTLADTRAFLKESDHALDFEDKITIIKGDLSGAIGVITNFDVGGTQVTFKPLNLEGCDVEMQVDRDHCVKYFGLGDAVQIIDGKYNGECGIVVGLETVHMPLVKLDGSQIEVKINTKSMKLKDLRNSDNLAQRSSR